MGPITSYGRRRSLGGSYETIVDYQYAIIITGYILFTHYIIVILLRQSERFNSFFHTVNVCCGSISMVPIYWFNDQWKSYLLNSILELLFSFNRTALGNRYVSFF